MTSFDVATSQDALERPVGAGGSVYIEPATGASDPMATEAGQKLLAFFEEKTGGTRPVTRRDFTPADLRSRLQNIMMVDLAYDDFGDVSDAVIRLLGSALAAYYGEYTGRSVLTHPSQSGARLLKAANCSRENGDAPVIVRVFQDDPELPQLDIRTLYIPIADNMGNIVQGLMMAEFFNRQGRRISGL
jgi:hypothetical protein